MFGQNQNLPENKTPTNPIGDSGVKDDVYVMPEKFRSQKSSSSANKTLLIVSVILIAIVVITGSYFIYNSWQANQAKLTVNQNASINTNENTNANEEIVGNINNNANENANDNINANENVNTNENDNDNANDNANVNANTNTNENTNQVIEPVLSSDVDRDGLTDIEENIIGTSSQSPDSDKDGYSDSQELVNGYDPTVSAASGEPFKLDTAAFLSALTTNFTTDNFGVNYIKGWSVSFLEALREARIIAGTGEMFKIYVVENADKLSAANWYLLNDPTITLSDLRAIDAGDFQGIYAKNGLSAYLTDSTKSKIYVFEYDLDNISELRYQAIFDLIIKSFKLVATPPVE